MYIKEINLYEGALNVTLTIYIQDSSINQTYPIIRPAILICPGGAYISITEKEAEPIAIRFVSAGFNAFVIRYSIGTGMANFPTPFIDVAKAIHLIRENARKWFVDSDKITLCGFSTGGHLAAIVASSWQDSYISEALKVDKNLIKPNSLILGYPLLDMNRFEERHSKVSSNVMPIIEMMFTSIFGTANPSKEQLNEWNAIKKVSKHMPPTFLWTTSEDALINVEESLDFIKVLARQGISYEYHVFEKGAHGLALGDKQVGYTDDEIKDHVNAISWLDLALKWLEAH